MSSLLLRLFGKIVRRGNLRLTTSNGSVYHLGDNTGPLVHIRINSRRAERSIVFNPNLAVPEAYMGGDLDLLEGDVLGLLRIVYENTGPSGQYDLPFARAAEGFSYAVRRIHQLNTTARSRRNVQRHYDLSRELYKLFLDEDMQYSCAYFERPDMTLEEAQLAKKRHIAAKLQIKAGQTILDIGSGWGGLALYLARNFDVDVLGVTLSTEQHALATERAQAEGLDQRVHFEIRDYRHLSERFDRIVSVGMFEHVGVNHYRSFFDKCATLLKPDGVMLLHSIGRFGPPAATAAFIRKYIFPGGYIPAISEVMPAVEKSGLMTGDIEILRLHYAETLKSWRERFMANRDKAKAIYDERFCRMWEFYLAGSEAAFRWQDMMNFQLQLTRRNDTLPMTRSYMDKGDMDHQPEMEEQPAALAARPKRKRKVAE
jgi:cyclopropane-fatty-acyl-phospholipid synthase